jgi:predicted alpha/beta-fold hydrolase
MRAILADLRAVASPAVQLVTTRRGGHVGFVAGRNPRRPSFWAEDLVIDWLLARAAIDH